ncbi:hypothetical protein ACP2Y6_06625 [Staphylococcus epidermidis]|nr:hypothetical protein SEVCU123_2218 [Staphylococcus epidermidis VCU123]MDH8901070.1 hypothetical protein [Staphylococcus epidermidis]
MSKTVKENSISIFDKQIYGKRLRAKEVQKQYDQLVDRIKKMNAKIMHYQHQDEFA